MRVSRLITRSNVANATIFLVWVLSAIAMLIRVYSLRFDPPQNPALFWVPYILFVSASAWIILTKNGPVPLFTIICMSFVLNLIIKIWWPENFLAGVDPPHHMQIASYISGTGHLSLGYSGFTGEALNYSFYPGLDLLLSIISMVAAVPLSTVYMYLFTFLNLLLIVFLYEVMKKLFGDGSKIAYLATFLYALSPRLHSFNNAAVAESLAIIFYPLLISLFVWDSRKSIRSRGMWLILLSFLMLVIITHHWTSYMLIIHAVIIASGIYVLSGEISRTKINILLIMSISLGVWLFFVLNSSSLSWTKMLIQALFSQSSGEQVTLPQVYSMPFLERMLTYGGIGILLVTSLLAASHMWLREWKDRASRIKNLPLIIWWLIDAVLIVAFELVSWRSTELIQAVDIRFRNLEFAYFGVAILSAVGIVLFMKMMDKRVKLPYVSKIAGLLLILIIAVPTITLGFSYYVYDSAPLKSSDAALAYPRQSFMSSMWLKRNTDSGWIAAPYSELSYISGLSHMNFSYEGFVESVNEHKLLLKTYSINKATINGPDDFNFTLRPDDVAWMNDNLNKIYDNGALTNYAAIEGH